MNLNEEKKYQMRQEVFEEIGLADKNIKIAEDYLDMTKEERKELLEQVEKQSFAALTNEQRQKSIAYLNYLDKRKQQEEMDRYMRLMFSIGGSTCGKVLVQWGYSINKKDIFEEVQAIAVNAEMMVWNANLLDKNSLKVLWEPARKEPEILLDAMEYCYNPMANAKVLLTAIYLNCKEPNSHKGSFLKGLVKGKDDREELKEQVAMMEGTFLKSLPNLFQTNLSEEEEK